MRHLLTLVSLLFIGSLWADDFNFNSPRAKAAMEKYQYDKEDLLRDLEAALKYERTEGRLEEAIKIRDAIATLKQQPDAPVANAQIPADAVEWNGHYYKLFTDKVHFPKAANHCAALGGHLIRIDSADENKFARKFASQGGVTTMWIDGTDSWADEGDWRYSNGQKMNYSNWPNHEPDGGKIENRVAMWENALWYADLGELWDLAYICEWDGPTASTQREKKIPADATEWNGHFYKAIPLRGTHQAALNQCVENGGHLVRIESKDEQEFIEKLLADSNESHWIDGSDAAREGRWMFSNGTPMQYFNWGVPGEPSNRSGDTGAPQHFLTIYPESFTWDDKEPSRHHFPFICEWEGDDPQASDGVFLDDLQEVEFGTIYNAVTKHGYGSNNSVILYNGVKPSHSLFIHPPGGGTAFVRYDLNGAYERLRGKVGLASLRKPDGSLNQTDKSASPVIFKVFGDDELLWESKPIQAFGSWLDCDVSIAGVNNLRLTTEALGSNNAAHATWIMPELKPAIKNGSKQSKTRPEKPIKKLSPQHAKRVLDDANLWEGKPGVWFLKRDNNFSGRTYERLSQSNRIRSALASVNGRLPTEAEMNNPPSRR